MCVDADIFFFDKHSRSDGENYLTNGRTYDVTDDGFSAVLNILFLLSGSWESLRHVFLPSPDGGRVGEVIGDRLPLLLSESSILLNRLDPVKSKAKGWAKFQNIAHVKVVLVLLPF